MSPPILRGFSPMVSTVGTTLTIPLPARNVDDLIILYHKGVTGVGASDGTRPVSPPGYHLLVAEVDTSGWVVIAWKRGGPDEPDVTLTRASTLAPWANWSGHVEVWGNTDYRDAGWLDVPGGAGNYARITRTALTTPADYQFTARVAFDATGVVNWVSGWASGDAGFGLDADNKLVAYVNNTSGNPIGNAPSAGVVPVAPNQKVWIQGIIDVATAECSYAYSLDDVENLNSVQFTGLGAPVVGTNAGTTPRVTNSGTLFIGARDAATTPTAQQVYALYDATVATGIITSVVFSNPDPAGFALVGTAKVYRPSTGVSSPIESFDLHTAPLPPDAIAINALPVFGADRIVQHVWTGTNTTGQVANPIAPGDPPEWTSYPDRFASFTALFIKDVMRTKVVSADVEPVTVASTTAYDFGYYELVIRPLPPVALPPASPQPPQISLGCADSYGVWVLEADYETRIDKLNFSALTWERGLDIISSARATLPSDLGGTRCIARAGGLEPWAYGLLIERNDQEVWRGPVVTVSRQDANIVVGAADVLSRYQKLPAVFDAIVKYTNADSGLLFHDVATVHSFSSVNRWRLQVPSVVSGVVVNRVLKPREFKNAWDLLSELLNASLDAYVMNGVLYVWEPGSGWQYQADLKRTLPGPYNSEYDFVYGTFTEESFSTRPNWTLDGAGQTNYDVVPGTETGEMGFRTYQYAESADSQDKYGLLFGVDPDSTEIPEDTPPALVQQLLQARANTIIALRSLPPLTVEGGVLSQSAPVSVDHLRPGSLWKMDVFDEGHGQLLTYCRLRRVSVSVTVGTNGIEETVSPTLEPPGWQGALT